MKLPDEKPVLEFSQPHTEDEFVEPLVVPVEEVEKLADGKTKLEDFKDFLKALPHLLSRKKQAHHNKAVSYRAHTVKIKATRRARNRVARQSRLVNRSR